MADENQENGAETSDMDDETEQMLAAALKEAQSSVDELRVQTDASAGAGAPASDTGSSVDVSGIEMLGDVDLHVSIELGRTTMVVEDVLKLADGCVVELDKLAGDPVDVYVNNRLVARGEVLVLNDNFCIRISEIIGNLDAVAAAATSEAG